MAKRKDKWEFTKIEKLLCFEEHHHKSEHITHKTHKNKLGSSLTVSPGILNSQQVALYVLIWKTL